MSQAPPVRRRGGLIPRLVFAFATTLLLVELGLRLVLGNGGQGLVVQPASTREVCYSVQPGAEAAYTGDAVRAPRTLIGISQVGTRGPEVVTDARLRVAFIGDSFAFGQGVEDQETLVARAGRELERRGYANQALNLAVPGTSPAQAVARLEAHLDRLKPDVAVLVVAPDDLDPGGSDCPHQGVVVDDSDRLSAGTARRELALLLSTRIYMVRAARLFGEVGMRGLVAAGGPYGPGRERLGRVRRVASASVPGPVFAAMSPKEQWGDVPILLPSKQESPPVVPNGREEYAFIAAVERLQRLGRARGIPVAVVLLADRESFERITGCLNCRPPQRLLGQSRARVVDLATWWGQMLREPDVYFQRGEGWLSAQGHALVGDALAADLASWPGLRELINGAEPAVTP